MDLSILEPPLDFEGVDEEAFAFFLSEVYT